MLRPLFSLPGLLAGLFAGLVLFAGSAAAHTADLLFVANRDSSDVAVIDSARDQVVGRIPTGAGPHQVGWSETHRRLIVSNSEEGSLSFIDGDTLQETARLHLGGVPEHLAVSPDGHTVAVGNMQDGTIALIPVAEGPRPVRRVAGFRQPHGLSFSSDGQRIYIADLAREAVRIVETRSGRLLGQLEYRQERAQQLARRSDAASGTPHPGRVGVVHFSLSDDGRFGFAAYATHRQLAVFDLASGTHLTSIPLGANPWRVYRSTDGGRIAVPNEGDGSLSLIRQTEENGLRLERVIPATRGMTGVNFVHEDRYAYVIGRKADELAVLDVQTGSRLHVIDFGPGASPETGQVSADGRKYYVALGGHNAVAVIDTRTHQLVGRIEQVGEHPWGVFHPGSPGYCH